ncbi:AMP-binding protein [Pelagicoccus sp. SDUM812002]|uniref:AMP-binding protein n=1 Tax=Pelagicoccus sp. SDUM812002 TaxID=3041266 RepID=UPI00280C763B|nr:AMP-binding protein [Pelagicoccus sp. SDUM812002]MDQ8185823.1 AMP-binding protein [Pelagicoccus sp. SDUM812002]
MTDSYQKPQFSCIHSTLLERASIDANRDILIDEERCLNAGGLVQRIEVIASNLVAQKASGRVVGILTDNTIDAVAAYYACLYAGAVVATLPRGVPAVTSQIIANGNVSILLTDRKNSSALQTQLPVIALDDLKRIEKTAIAPVSDPRLQAHLLFTSGTTTGKPRTVFTDHIGSMLSHAWRTKLWPYEPHDVVGCNIFGMWDVVPALHAGAPAVLLTDSTIRDPLRLAAAVTRYGITRMMLTPTLLDTCLRCPEAVTALSRLRLLVLCGEGISQSLHIRIGEQLPCVRIVNLYSLSECHDVAAGDLPPPGQPMHLTLAPFAQVNISKEQDREQLVPEGTAGRIIVSGPGLAKPASTERAENAGFFTLLTQESHRVDAYDTGDRGILLPDGTLEVLGRCESNVKIRGMWVAPTDVEATLLRYPGVAQACVTTSNNAMGHLSLQAHIVPPEEDAVFDVDALHQWLRDQLHPAAVPSRIVVRKTLPLLASGKVDRTRLAQPQSEAADMDKKLPSKTRSIVEQVKDAFQKVLDRRDIKDDDSFSKLGGDSLAAVALCVEVERCTGRRLTPPDLQAADTPAALADRLKSQEPTKRSDTPLQPPLLSPLPAALKKRTGSPTTILVTGATGSLGKQLVHLLTSTAGVKVLAMVRSNNYDFPENVRTVVGDLTLPQLGWSDATFDAIALEVDTIIHVGADTNIVAPYSDLHDANVRGTDTVIGLAARAGAKLLMVSSSAVFPLHCGTRWSESFHGFERLSAHRAQLIASGADGYSLTKHDAELLAWQACEQGLPLHVIRIPHILTPNQPSRLSHVAKAWAASGIMPEGPWHWQFVDPHTIAVALLSIALSSTDDTSPLVHVTLAPVSADEIQTVLTSLGHATGMATLPACTEALCKEGTLAPLITRYGPAATMCVNEPMLEAKTHSRTDATDTLCRYLKEVMPASMLAKEVKPQR